MRGGKRIGSGRKKKPVHLKRNPVTIRLPQWMMLRLKRDGEIGYLIEEQLAKKISEITRGLQYQQLNGTGNLLRRWSNKIEKLLNFN